jgi:sugar lactone lactonase YvrE
LRYLGGTIQIEPRVHIIFWGSNFNEGTGASLRTQLLKFYNGLTASSEQGILTQYFGQTTNMNSQVAVDSYTDTRVPAPSNVTANTVEEEISYAITAHQWQAQRGVENQFDVITAPGSTYDSTFAGHYCAFHNVDAAGDVYSFVPYAGDEPFKEGHHCTWYGNGNTINATSVMASHEYAESATDPLWDTSPGWNNLQGFEIADICATPGEKLANEAFVQGWYDDHQNKCSTGDSNPPHVLALSDAPTGVGQHEATIHATINPEGLTTTYYFEYGTTEAYGTRIPASGEFSAGSARANVEVQQALTGLQLEQPYHYRVVATNSNGTTDSEDQTAIPSKWKRQAPPREGSWGEDWLNNVACATTTSCMAVGYYYNAGNYALAYRLSGGHWAQTPVPLAEGESRLQLFGVSCTTASSCTAVGRSEVAKHLLPFVVHWNGSAWSKQSLALPSEFVDGELYGVSCPAPEECMAVGTAKTSAGVWVGYSERLMGATWTPVAIPTASESTLEEVRSVSCTAANFCMASGWYNSGSGAKPFSELWNGSVWSLQTRSGYGYFYGMTCVSSEFCMAAGGDFSNPLEETWNGQKWTKVTTATLPDLVGGYFSGISCSSQTSCAAVGGGWSKLETNPAVTLAETWDGSAWKEQTTPRDSERARNELEGVSCTAIGACTAVGWSEASGPPESIVETRPLQLATGTYSTSFGSLGAGNGQLNRPAGVAVDPIGNVWVADRENNRIEKFNEKGEYLGQFGSKGSGNGQFNKPQSIAVAKDGNGNEVLWVTDAENNRVQEFNEKGEYLRQFGSEGSGQGQFTEPWGIAVSPEGNIWVSDSRYYRIEEFNSSGGFIREVHGTGHGGSGPAEFFHPTGIAIDGEGDVWVVDCRNNRVQELSSTGAYISQFGTEGSGEGQLSEPTGIAIKSSGDLLVADARNHRVAEFTPAGESVTQFGSQGSGAGQFSEPDGIALGRGGSEFISDPVNARVEKWYQPALPEATAPTATSIKGKEATLNGLVNPSGQATTYRFEYGTTTNYGTSAPIPGGSAGSGTEAVAEQTTITGLSLATTYHYRLVAESSAGTTRSEDKTFTTLGATSFQLTAMPVTDPFNATTSVVSNFGSNWSVLGWASGKGEDRATGWGPTSTYPSINGAFFNPVVNGAGAPIAAVATMATSPGGGERSFSLWLDMTSPGGSRSGYQLTFTSTATNLFNITLSKWVAGSQTILASKQSNSFSNGNSLALVDSGGTVSAWTETGSGFSEVLKAQDSTYEGGNVGVEGVGNVTRLNNFKTGALQEPAANMNAALQALPVNDSFATSESPLSDGGAFAALSWANGSSGHNTGRVAGGWGPYDAYSTINGAFWQQASFADSGSGDAVSALLTHSPEGTSRYFSLWLNMPSPGSTRSGYELRFTETSFGLYEATLSKWQSGTKTVLASTFSYSLPLSSQFALADKAGTVSAWTKTGSEYTQLLSAADTTYTSGYSGLEGSGNITRLKEFRSGPLAPF